jgi:hypothetical protein
MYNRAALKPRNPTQGKTATRLGASEFLTTEALASLLRSGGVLLAEWDSMRTPGHGITSSAYATIYNWEHFTKSLNFFVSKKNPVRLELRAPDLANPKPRQTLLVLGAFKPGKYRCFRGESARETRSCGILGERGRRVQERVCHVGRALESFVGSAREDHLLAR